MFENRALFDGRVLAAGHYSFEGHLREMVHYLGPPPRDLVSRSDLGDSFFDIEGMTLPRPVVSYCSVNTQIRVGKVRSLPSPTFKLIWELEENLSGEEQQQFLDFIKSMLCWLPEERLSARELLEHPWLVTEVNESTRPHSVRQ